MRRRAPAWIVATLVAFAAYGTIALLIDRDITGDEPHYVVAARSIVEDHDLALGDDYADDRTLAIVPDASPGDQARVYERGGPLRPVHEIGLPLLWAPVLAIRDSVTALQVLHVLMAALVAGLAWALLDDLQLAPGRRRLLVWCPIAFTLPLLVFADQLYPETPGALLLLVVARLLVRPPTLPRLAGAVALASLLPWLHLRFAVIALVVVAIALVRAVTLLDSTRRWRGLAVVTLPAIVLGAGLVALHLRFYDSASPFAAYGEKTAQGSDLEHLWSYGFGFLFDPAFGLLSASPVYLLVLASLPLLVLRYRKLGWVIIGALALDWSTIAIPGGESLGRIVAGRLFVWILPLAVVPLALVLDRRRVPVVTIAVGLTAWSALVAVAAVRNLDDFITDLGTPQPAVRNPIGIWPVTAVPNRDRIIAYPIGLQISSTGREVTPGRGFATARRAVEGIDPPGLLVNGPGLVLAEGPARAVVGLAVTEAGDPSILVATAEVTGDGRMIARREIRAGELPAGGRSRRIQVPFESPGGRLIVLRVEWHGHGIVTIDNAAMTLADIEETEFPDVTRTLAWLGLLGGGSAWLVVDARRARAAAPPVVDAESAARR